MITKINNTEKPFHSSLVTVAFPNILQTSNISSNKPYTAIAMHIWRIVLLNALKYKQAANAIIKTPLDECHTARSINSSPSGVTILVSPYSL